VSNYLDEYVAIVAPVVPLFEDMCNKNHRRATLHHQVGLINTAIAIQQFVVMGTHIEKIEGSITIARMSGIIGEIAHLLADRMAFMSDMDDEILAATADGMYSMIARVVEALGLDWDPDGE